MATFDFSVKPVEALRNDLDKVTILRALLETPPVAQLINLMNELLSDDAMPYDIQWAYHDFASAVLASTPPTVTGDRWRDCLIEAVLEKENISSIAASKGRQDDMLQRAFARDLNIIQALFLLDDSMVRIWCTPSQNGADLSNWAAFSSLGFYIVEGDGPLPAMRRMLLSSEDWSQLAKPLMDLHAQFGAGAALGHRYLNFSHDGLQAVARPNSLSYETDPRLSELLNAHAAGKNPGPIFIGGPFAMRAALAALAPLGLNVVRLNDVTAYAALRDRLDGARTRYAVLMPAPHPADPLLSDLLGEGLERPADNLLPVALSPAYDPMLAPRFALSIRADA